MFKVSLRKEGAHTFGSEISDTFSYSPFLFLRMTAASREMPHLYLRFIPLCPSGWDCPETILTRDMWQISFSSSSYICVAGCIRYSPGRPCCRLKQTGSSTMNCTSERCHWQRETVKWKHTGSKEPHNQVSWSSVPRLEKHPGSLLKGCWFKSVHIKYEALIELRMRRSDLSRVHMWILLLQKQ